MSEAMLRILFVDDEPRILDGLRRQLHSYRKSWDMRFALSADEALRMLSEVDADIVVSDMRMPGVSGGELLERVLRAHPHTTRIMLSGQTDPQELLHDIGAIHQFLQKPCEPARLCEAIERTYRLSQLLRQPQLRLIANRVTALPPSTNSYRALLSELAKPDASLTSVGEIVAGDTGLSVKLMQLVNSAFFGMPRKIASPQEAVVLLGLRTVHALVITSRLFRFFESEPVALVAINELWQASVQLGELAAQLAKRTGGNDELQRRCRLAGMLSLVGRAIMVTADLGLYDTAISTSILNDVALSDAEYSVYEANQQDVGAYALGLWGFSDEIVDAVHLQAAPRLLPQGSPVHVACYLHLARGWLQASMLGAQDRFPLDPNLAKAMGIEQLMPGDRRSIS